MAVNCSLRINPDGTFGNKECTLQTNGQIKGDVMDLKVRAANNFCDIVTKLKKT